MTTPTIGAALDVADLNHWRDWILTEDRDVEVQDFLDPHIISGDWAPVAAEARRLLDGHHGRLGIHGPFYGFTIDANDADVRAVVRKRLDQGLDVCEALGATQMVIHSPYTTWDGHNLDLLPGARDRMTDRVHDCLDQAVRRAEQQGVTIVIENIEDTDPMDRLHLAESFGSDAVAVSLDTGHAHYAHVSNGAPPVDRYVDAAGARLAHVHLQDADGYADRHWAIGEGTVLWPSVFGALARSASRPHLVLELADKRGIAASMRFLEAAGLGQ